MSPPPPISAPASKAPEMPAMPMRHCDDGLALTHIDVDEFILSTRPVSDCLADIPDDTILTRLEPYRGDARPRSCPTTSTPPASSGVPFGTSNWHLQTRRALGPYAEINRDGLLSHSNGKVIFRRGVRGLAPRLHGVFLQGVRVDAPDWHPAMKLLHFHAQDRQAWRAALPFRLTRGAYQYRAGFAGLSAGGDPRGGRRLLSADPGPFRRVSCRIAAIRAGDPRRPWFKTEESRPFAPAQFERG
jgi:hypothetical protein